MGYSNIVKSVCDTLLVTQNGSLPIDPFATIAKRHWSLLTYSEFATDFRDRQHLVDIFHDAFSFFNLSKGFTVVYNERLPIRDIRFALAHEIAHIELGHFHEPNTVLSYTRKSVWRPTKYNMAEFAANVYASCYLCPPSLLNICKFTSEELQNIFNISEDATRFALLLLNDDLTEIDSKTDFMIKELFVDSLRPHYFYPYHSVPTYNH